MVGIIRKAIELDLEKFNEGETTGFVFMVHVPEFGMVVPFSWIKNFAHKYEDKWDKFMDRQTVVAEGAYVCDVERFLQILEKEAS